VPKIDDVEKIGVCTAGNAEGRECWPNCPAGFTKTATGVCTKPRQTQKRDKFCPDGYSAGDGNCALVPGKEPERKPLGTAGECSDPEFSISHEGKCYPKCPAGYEMISPGSCKKI
jgi:hypothetical protein